MPEKLRKELQQLIDRPTRLFEMLGFGFLTAFSLALPDWREMMKPDYWTQFTTHFGAKIAPFVLICVTIFWYSRFKATATKELDLIDNLFDEERSPIHRSVIAWHRALPVMGYLIVGIFAVLILLAPYISLYCIVAFALHANDLMGQALMFQNLNKTLVMFPLAPERPRAKFTAERRKIILEYYYDNPTFPRIASIFIVTAVAFIIAIEIAPTRPTYYLISYALMTTNILVGELFIEAWRRTRDRKLDEIARREELEIEKMITNGAGMSLNPPKMT